MYLGIIQSNEIFNYCCLRQTVDSFLYAHLVCYAKAALNLIVQGQWEEFVHRRIWVVLVNVLSKWQMTSSFIYSKFWSNIFFKCIYSCNFSKRMLSPFKKNWWVCHQWIHHKSACMNTSISLQLRYSFFTFQTVFALWNFFVSCRIVGTGNKERLKQPI